MYVDKLISVVNNVYNNQYELINIISKTISYNDKVSVKHNDCGAIWQVEVSNLIRGNTDCPNRCKHRSKQLQKFKNKLLNLKGNEYTVIGDYYGAEKPILLQHNLCGKQFNFYPHSLRNKKTLQCPYCNGRLIDTKIFKERIKELVGDEYIVLGEYKNTENKVHMLHKKCGNDIYISPHAFFKGIRCKYCQHRSTKKTTEEFAQEILHKFNGEYAIIGEYLTAYHDIQFKHNKCGKVYYTTPHSFLNNNGVCPFCNITHKKGGYKKTTEHFKKEVYDLFGNEYSVLGEYINTNTEILMLHNKCKTIFQVKPHKFLGKHTRCPNCGGSTGENFINNILETLCVFYKREYTISKCKNIKPLPFDFAIFEDEEKTKLKCLIEYDGEQHYRAVDFFWRRKIFST